MTRKADTTGNIDGARLTPVDNAELSRKMKYLMEVRLPALRAIYAAQKEAGEAAKRLASDGAKAPAQIAPTKAAERKKLFDEQMRVKFDALWARLPELRVIYASQEAARVASETEAKAAAAPVPEAVSKTNKQVHDILVGWLDDTFSRRRQRHGKK